MTPDELVRSAAIAMWYWRNKFAEPSDWELQTAGKAVAVALEQAAKVVTEHYEELCTEHRLLLLNRAAAIRNLIGEK